MPFWQLQADHKGTLIMAAGEPKPSRTGTIRHWFGYLISLINLVIFVVFTYLLLGRSAEFSAPWSGPEVATLALATATLVLGCVALFVELIAIWGYTTIKDRAADISREVAQETAIREARMAIRQHFQAAMGGPAGGHPGDASVGEIRDAFRREGE
jgi:hypothetical protein